MGAMARPKGLTKMKNWSNFQHLVLLKKKFPRGTCPRPQEFANLLHIFGAGPRWHPPMRMSGAACELHNSNFLSP